jgi:rare lipoprotein A
MHGMTAAHKTLPIPTWVEVKNLDNGRQIIVRVNDRGPFVHDRIIDLSYRAATELDIIGKGTARVQVRALGAPAGGAGDTGPVMAETRTSESTDAGGFSLIASANAAPVSDGGDLYVQVGAFSDRDNAIGMVSRLKQSGFENAFLLGGGRDALYRVRIGPLEDVRQFDSVRSELRSLGVGDSRLVTNEM